MFHIWIPIFEVFVNWEGYEILIKNGIRNIQDNNLGLTTQIKMTANRMFPLYVNNIQQSFSSLK